MSSQPVRNLVPNGVHNVVEDGSELGADLVWVSVAAAAQSLGISETAIRKRIKAGTVLSRGGRGATEVLVEVANQTQHGSAPSAEPAQPGSEPNPQSDHSGLVARYEEEIAFLRSELAVRTEEIRRRDHIIAGFIDRLPASPSAIGVGNSTEPSTTAPDSRSSTEPTGPRSSLLRPWWRRLFGG